MADNNSVLTTVLVVVAVLLFTGNLTGNQVRGGDDPSFYARQESGIPAGSQLTYCKSDFFRSDIPSGNHRAGAVPGGGYRVEVCDEGLLRAYFCADKPTALGANKYLLGQFKQTTDPLVIGCQPLNVQNSAWAESSL